MRILERALFICVFCALVAPAALAGSSSGGWQPPAELPGASLVPLDEAEGRTALILRRAATAPAADQSSSGAPAARTDGSQNITVIVDGIVMELPFWVVEGLIRNGTFIVVGRWTIDFGVIVPVLR